MNASLANSGFMIKGWWMQRTTEYNDAEGRNFAKRVAPIKDITVCIQTHLPSTDDGCLVGLHNGII